MDLRLSFIDCDVNNWSNDIAKYLKRYSEVIVFDLDNLSKGALKLFPLWEYNEAGEELAKEQFILDGYSDDKEEELFNDIMENWNNEPTHYSWYEGCDITDKEIGRSIQLLPFSDDEDDKQELISLWNDNQDVSGIIREQFTRYDEGDYSDYNDITEIKEVSEAECNFGIFVYNEDNEGECVKTSYVKTKKEALYLANLFTHYNNNIGNYIVEAWEKPENNMWGNDGEPTYTSLLKK